MNPSLKTINLDRFFNLSLDLLCIAGFDGYFKQLNPVWTQLLGFSDKELKARPLLDFVHPDDRAATQAEGERLGTGAETVSFENRYRCRDGSYRWLLWSVSVSLEDELFYAAARDITDRKKIEAQMQRQNRLLELLKEVALETSNITSLPETLQIVIDLICTRLDWTLGHAYLTQPGPGSELVPTSIWFPKEAGRFAAFRETTMQTTFKPDEGLLGETLQEAKSTWFKDISQDTEFIRGEVAQAAGIRSALIVPILIRGEIVGAMEFFSEQMIEPNAFDLTIMDQIGCQIIGQVIERLRTAERFQALVQNATDLIIVLATDGTITYISPSVTHILGYTPETMLGTAVFDYIHPAEAAVARTTITTLCQSSDVLVADNIRVRHQDGVWRVLEVKGNNLLHLPSIQGLVINARDVTEQEQAYQALRESERLYRTLIKSFPNGAVVLFDRDLRYKVAVGAGLAEVGLSGEWMEGKTIWEVFPPETCAAIEPDYRAALAGEHIRNEVPYADRTYMTYAIPVSDEEGDIFAGMVVTQDISQLKRTQAELQQREELFRSIFENAPIGISIGEQGRVIQCNPAFQQLLGYAAGELIDKHFSEITMPDDLPASQQHYADLVSGKQQNVHLEKRYRSMQGQIIWTNTMLATINGDTEHRPRLIALVEDITQRKASEAKQVELIDQLQVVNKELNQFAYVVSHDLKAPLRAISSLAGWISSDYADVLDEDGQEQLQLLVDRVKRMDGLINGILDYSRAGRNKDRTKPVNLEDVIEDVVNLISPPDHVVIERTGLALPTVTGDETQLDQIFQNLLQNAIKYGDKPTIEIKVDCLEKGDQWQFSIADNGPGIEADYFEKIFQIFQTLVPRDEIESTGVGLAIVKKIVESYGGRIWVESTLTVGTTFYFTLPKAPVQSLNGYAVH